MANETRSGCVSLYLHEIMPFVSVQKWRELDFEHIHLLKNLNEMFLRRLFQQIEGDKTKAKTL